MSTTDDGKILPLYKDTGYGFSLCPLYSPDALESALKYKPRPDDIFIVTYPKCGTTWMQNIVSCIYRKGKPYTSVLEFCANSPYLEMTGSEAAENMPRPGSIKTHLPFHLAPWSSQAKYILVARNPKDCLVSFYYHTKHIRSYKFQNGTFDDFFDLFMEGKVDYGDYYDIFISWYLHKDEPNVLFITYEELKKDLRTCVLKIAEFMGPTYKEMLIHDEGILNDVVKNSSLEFMKENLNRQIAELLNLPKDVVQKDPHIPVAMKDLVTGDCFYDPNAVDFVRKGIVGDYKNHLSPEQNRRLEEKLVAKTIGTDIAELWKDIMDIDVSNQEKLFLTTSNTSSYFVFGLKFSQLFPAVNVISAMSYKPRSDDVILSTYPKCGTTWTQQILILIFRQGEPLASCTEFFTTTPFLEATGAEAAEKMPRPNAIKVHLPYYMTPRSDKAKYIYVTRNPKDCCVSYFHHMKSIPLYGFNGNFDEFFELFITGKNEYGDYFDHLLGWYAHRNDPNVLFMTYEEMKERPEEIVLKIASFIDEKKYAEPLQNDPEKLHKIVKYSSFSFMKESFNKMMDDVFQMTEEEMLKSNLPEGLKKSFARLKFAEDPEQKDIHKKSDFVRKGIIGDWRNYFSEEQSQRLDEKFAERTKGTDIPKMFEKYM